MPGFKGNQDRLIAEGYPKRWLWQGSPYVALLPVIQPLIVLPQQRLASPSVVILPTRIPVPPPPPDYPSKQLFVAPQSLRPTTPAILGRAIFSASVLQTPLTKHLIVSIRPPGLRPTTPSLLSAGIGIVPEPSELLRSPVIVPPELPPPTPPPTFHAGVMREAIIPPITPLIVPPAVKLISPPSVWSWRTGQEIIIPRGQLVVPAQELPKTRPSIFRQFPSVATAEPSTFWIPRGWVPDGWVPLPAAEEIPPAGASQQLIVPSAPKQQQTPTALLRSFRPEVPIALSHPSRPMIVPPQVGLVSPQPNTLKWRTPPLEATSLPLAQPLVVPPQAYPDPRPTLVRSVVQPTAVVPQSQPLIVPGQPSPAAKQAVLDWFTPEAIIPPSGQFLIVLPELPPDYTRPRLAVSRTTRFPTPTVPPINAQLVVRAHPRILYQQPFAILGGESVTVPPPFVAQLSLGLLAYESNAEFVFSRESSSTF